MGSVVLDIMRNSREESRDVQTVDSDSEMGNQQTKHTDAQTHIQHLHSLSIHRDQHFLECYVLRIKLLTNTKEFA